MLIGIRTIMSATLGCLIVFSTASAAFSANYPLEIVLPEANDNTNNRYYKAYPGLRYEVPVGVFGGAYPFTYSLDRAPSGMNIDPQTGIITWGRATTSGSPHNVTVRVADSESNSVTQSWTITVTTSGFIFVDSVNGTPIAGNGCSSNCGDGSIGNPLRDLSDVYHGINPPQYLNQDTTFDDYFLYFRAGTYYPQGVVNNSGVKDTHIDWRVSKPIVWMAYPGENVVVDFDHPNADETGAAFKLDNSSNAAYDDLWIQGITFRDMLNNAFYFSGTHHNVVIYDNIFTNLAAGSDGYNTAYLMVGGTGISGSETKHLYSHNTFHPGQTEDTFIKTYSTRKLIIDSNTLDNGNIAIKAYSQYTDIRGNTIKNHSAGSIAGNWNNVADMEIRFNNILNSDTTYSGGGQEGAIVMNYHDTAGEVFVYRNTINGSISLHNGTSDDGPFHVYSNVIVNENGGIDNPNGTHITQSNGVSTSSILRIGTGSLANLAGSTNAGIIDTNNALTSGYDSYLGTHGHLIDGSSSPIPRISVPQAFSVR